MKKKPEIKNQGSSNKNQDSGIQHPEPNQEQGSRRSFIRNAALAAAGFYIVPRHMCLAAVLLPPAIN